MSVRIVTCLLLVSAIGASCFADEFYTISSVSASTEATDLWSASNLIQGPGVGFDAAAPYDKLVGGAEGNWVTADDAGFPSDYVEQVGKPVITLDLGADVDLGEISVWGYASTNANGVSEFSLRFASEADGLGGFGSSIALNPSFTLTNEDIVRQSKSFGEIVSARYVEFTADDNFFVAPGDGSGGELAGGDRVGLGEIAFQVIPEPSTGCLLLLASLGVLGMRRRKGC